MPRFDVSVPHLLGKDDARTKLQGFSAKLQENYSDQLSDLQQEWKDDTLSFSFSTFGIGVNGALTVGDQTVDVEGELPFTAAMFKGKIVSAIQEQLSALLK